MLQRFIVLCFFCYAISACQLLNTKLQITASSQINLDQSNHPLAVSMRAYLLTDATTFTAATYEQIWHSDQRVLGKDIIKHFNWIQQPSRSHQISFKPHAHARYIAVIALFRNPKLGTWRLVKSLDQVNMSALFPIKIRLDKNNLTWSGHGS